MTGRDANALARSARSLVLAVQYFTRVPIPAALARWTGFSAELQRAGLAHFPGVGWGVAAVAALCYGAAMLLLPQAALTPVVGAVMSTIATVLLTGALHEDGLADAADGLGGTPDRERALDIMKDSRMGAYGVLALVLALLLKIGLLGLIGSVAGWPGAVAALLGAHVVSRALALVIVATLPHIGVAATSKSLQVASRIEWRGLAVAALWCAPALAIVAALASPALCIAAVAVSVAMLLWVRCLLARRLQGFTGDCLGAAQQLCEVAFYLGAAIALGVG
jgi:adenosylcobinamide-GDP ribazoletransferase